MKRRLLMAAALLLAVTGFVKAQEAANPAAYITFSDAVIPQGGTGEMKVYYTVDNNSTFKAFQINVPLPEGITIKKVEMSSVPANITKADYSSLENATVEESKSKFFTKSNEKNGNSVVIGFQTGNEAFPATTGEKTLLCTLTLEAAESVTTNIHEDDGYSSTTSYIELTSSDTKVMASQNQDLKIKVFKLGDVNGDGEVDITDAVCVINKVVRKPNNIFYESVANVHQDDEIDITDAVSIINIVLRKTSSSQQAPKYKEIMLDPQ